MIFFKIKGNLGNWLFQYATAIAFSDGNCVGYVLPNELTKRARLDRSKEFLRDLCIVTELPGDIKSYKERCFRYQEIPVAFKDGNTLLDGYFQSEKYFKNNSELVRRILRPDKCRIEYLYKKFGAWLILPNVTSIHVRRGDYLKFQYMHPFVGKKYLIDAVNKIPECDNFIVFSDDIVWCKRFFKKTFKNKRFIFSEGNSVLDDFQLQMLCKNNIISNSSFSWWASWLNNNPRKRIIAPSLWFGFVVKKDEDKWDDIYTGRMEIVENHYTLWWLIVGYIELWWKNFKAKFYPLYAKILKRARK